MTDSLNISSWLRQSAERFPYKRAVVFPESRDRDGRVLYSQLTFEQLETESDSLAFGLTKAGIRKGTRTILMVRPGLEFFCLTFALFKVGAVPVMVDPGMGINRMLSCFQEGRPEAFIGIQKAHILRTLKPRFFKTVTTWVTVGKRWFWGGFTLDQLRLPSTTPFPVARTTAEDMAAILFTTGSTGPAKGVVYTHGTFHAQLSQIRDHFNIGPDEIDLPTFPLFALFDPALGMTAVIPDMDPTKPAQVNPERIIEAIKNQGVTNMFASPALLNRVGGFGKTRGVLLPSLKRVVSAGAPVSPANIEQFSALLTQDAQIHTPYGATEAVPIISIGSREILSETRKLSDQGFGMCIGRPIGTSTRIELIPISDTPVSRWSDDLIMGDNEVGEIVVKGSLVTTCYFENPKADLFAKINDDDGQVWHRMGDLAWRDSKGRYWFCGRKGHRVITRNQTLFTIPCEAIFNNHAGVFRSALVGIGPSDNQTPVICIEPSGPVTQKPEFIREILDLAMNHDHTRPIEHVLIHPSFPVDIRHNSKIFREELALWAGKKIKH